MQLRLTVHSRAARLAFFPAYHLQYVHGEQYTPSRADIVPARYDALVGGGPEAAVAAELHPSPLKSQVRRRSSTVHMHCAACCIGIAASICICKEHWSR